MLLWTTYVMANPDGLFERQVIGINGQFPPPAINVTFNDTLVINVVNQLSEPMRTASEWDLLYCIHGHHRGHYVDGLRAPLIVHNPLVPQAAQGSGGGISVDFQPEWGGARAPVWVDQPTEQHRVPGKTYRLRIINMSALAMFHFYIDGHEVEIIEVDGVDVEWKTVKTFPDLGRSTNETLMNYYVHGEMDPVMFDRVPEDLVLSVRGKIVYNASETAPMAPVETVVAWPSFDDGAELVPTVPVETTTRVDRQFVVKATFQLMEDYVNRALFNEVPYVAPKVPSLFTALSMGSLANMSEVYGKHSNPMVVPFGAWVEIVIDNDDLGTHPFHLHGHVFQVVERTTDGLFDPSSGGGGGYPYFETTNPLRRDTVVVPAGTSAAIRFRALNPGVWFFHCHIEWHLEAGLAMTLIEAPEEMPRVLRVDPAHYEHCRVLGIPFQGNAAGSAGLDMRGMNVGPGLLERKFRAKGIVALMFSVLAAVMGLATVVWYAHEDEAEMTEQARQARLQKARQE
ncbi:ferroxidase fet3 [Mortierella alpina]|uniref:Ferroxidase fet3 n=1 Tax=Mortierella alpina TaxID=64518 RepID=A0A9P6J7A9_MORAP|nr:ferroxidase fet3 [Mortierella alpina]